MASGPITLWLIDGETVETVPDFILGASQLESPSAPMKDPMCNLGPDTAE